MAVTAVKKARNLLLDAAATVGAASEVAAPDRFGVSAVADAVPEVDFVYAAVEFGYDKTAKALAD
jgi:hypothetical protein